MAQAAATPFAGAREARSRPPLDYKNTNLQTGALFSSKKIYKIFQIPRHIESLNVCMKY